MLTPKMAIFAVKILTLTQYKVMAKVYQFMADGFEDIEALAPVDILRRGGLEVVTVSIMGHEMVTSTNGVCVKADVLFENACFDDADLLLLPGGLPGATNLKEHKQLADVLRQQAEAGRMIGAICAAPMVLGTMGLLQGRRATCYPGVEHTLHGAEYTGQLVTVDGNIITGEGPAAAFPYAYTLLAMLVGHDKAEEIQISMRYKHLMAERS